MPSLPEHKSGRKPVRPAKRITFESVDDGQSVKLTARNFYNDRGNIYKNIIFVQRASSMIDCGCGNNDHHPVMNFLSRFAGLFHCVLRGLLPFSLLLCWALPGVAQSQAEPATPPIASIENLIDTGRFAQARAALAQWPAETPVTQFLVAKLLFKERQFAASLAKLEPLLSGEAYRAEAHKLAGLNYVMLERLDLAEPRLKMATELAPEDYLAHFHLGMLHYLTSRFANAESEFRRTVKLQPAFAKGHDAWGLALQELEQVEAAVEAHRQAIALTEAQTLKDEAPYLNLGKFLLTKNRLAESLPLLEKAVQLRPNSAEAFFLLGKAQAKSNHAAEAVQTLLAATRLQPDYGDAHYLLSRLYLQQGRSEEARKEMEIFQALQVKKTKP